MKTEESRIGTLENPNNAKDTKQEDKRFPKELVQDRLERIQTSWETIERRANHLKTLVKLINNKDGQLDDRYDLDRVMKQVFKLNKSIYDAQTDMVHLCTLI